MNITKYFLCLVFLLLISAGVFAKGSINLDYDGKADYLVFRPSNGTWYGYRSENGGSFEVQWGLSTDRPVAADYDGDGITDVAVFRPETGIWYIRRSIDGQMLAIRWGLSTDELVPADYDGDGQTDIAVYRFSTGIWYVLTSTSGYDPTYFDTRALLPSEIPYSQSMVPAAGDFDNDQKIDYAVHFNGNYFIRLSENNALIRRGPAGCFSGVLTPFDFTGDGIADAGCITMYSDTRYTWTYRRSQDNQEISFVWGSGPNNDYPVPDDYDNDGHTDYAVFRNGDWWIFRSTTLSAQVIRFGQPGDLPAQWSLLKWHR